MHNLYLASLTVLKDSETRLKNSEFSQIMRLHVDYGQQRHKVDLQREYDDYTQLPEDTSLMRHEAYLLEGRKTDNGTGYLKDFQVDNLI